VSEQRKRTNDERERERARRAEQRRRFFAALDEGLSLREAARRAGISSSTGHAWREQERPSMPEHLTPWPPAEPGNTRAMTHGLDSDRVTRGVIEPRAVEIAPGIIAANPHLDTERDGLAVGRYAMVLARLERAYEWLANQPDDLFANAKTGEVHGLYGRLAKWEAQASRDEERLAISPRERTRLKLDQVRGRLLLGEAGRTLDLARLSDEELAVYRALLEKADAVEGAVAE